MTKPIAQKSPRRPRHRVLPPDPPQENVRGRSRGGPVEEPESAIENVPDISAGESLHERLDPETRYRMISERAYHLYANRGYADGNDVDDWLEAEAQIDALLG